jgi:hypothetical protein
MPTRPGGPRVHRHRPHERLTLVTTDGWIRGYPHVATIA